MDRGQGYVVAAKMAFAFLGFSALVTEIATLVARHRFEAGNFFSYFTVEANTLAIVSLLASSFVEANTLAVLSLVLSSLALAAGRRSDRLDFFRGAVTLYMTTTILVFIVLLSGYSSEELTAVPWDNTVLHYIMPIVVIVDWLVASRVRAIAFRRSMIWLGFPLVYLGYSLVRGPIADWYPYPFMDPAHHGYIGVIITSVVIAVVLTAITWVIATAPRWAAVARR
jgi:hypothetical protein